MGRNAVWEQYSISVWGGFPSVVTFRLRDEGSKWSFMGKGKKTSKRKSSSEGVKSWYKRP
jgi:hypothetical protein